MRSGPMPERAWVEVRREDGELIASVEADINGGAISFVLPGFAKGTRGWVRVREEGGPELAAPGPGEIEELPTEPMGHIWQVG